MAKLTSSVRYPNETAEYRAARDRLLAEEARLRQMTWDVAGMRRSLPPGGEIPQDYAFDELGPNGRKRGVRMSELFEKGKPSLVVYSFMYGPDDKAPCPMCTSVLDSLDGAARHIKRRANLAVVAKAPIDRIERFAKARGWRHLRLLSSAGNSYNRDYYGETDEGYQMPNLNVFALSRRKVRHMWSSELLYARSPDDPCHVDMIWPLWNVLDFTPEGRGERWYPSLED